MPLSVKEDSDPKLRTRLALRSLKRKSGDPVSKKLKTTRFTCAGQELRKHIDLWFEDSNIIIIVSDTAFRGHTSIISRESKVLEDLIKVAFRPSGSEFRKTCGDSQVIYLKDAVEDVTFMFQVLYDSKSLVDSR
ncbi:hypothetical protein SCP_0900430 [Sparassis crispa]|uniref:BTB domain-containing protein n=1 Tax=Sparassis crispa TaxID=139825 RepID=A0A401GVD8_9APHY|nr:hypothetical protein SCP_0900430 [Sparassis crispa]GBE86166.1 hypothetical protein SCP_0900430 [Sparassis crispa]